MSMEDFVGACGFNNNITRAKELLDTVDINGRDSTGLMEAMFHNNLPIVRMLLDHPNILGKLHKQLALIFPGDN